jgi:DNA polymerase-3 subunit epsilon
MAKLNLIRPLAFFDIETTGLNISKDRIVEISILKIYPPNGEKKESKTLLFNPGIPIPKDVSHIHGITDADVQNAPTFKECAKELAQFFDDCDLAGYNCNKFDIPLLAEEFLRAGIDIDIKNRKVVDVQTIFHKKEERTLSAAYKFYCGKILNNAHSAEADIYATFEILEAQLEKYKDIINDITYLHNYTSNLRKVDVAGMIIYNNENIPVFNFGKYKGKPVEDVFKKEPQYYDWIIKKDFPLYTKKVVTEIWNEIFQKQSQC